MPSLCSSLISLFFNFIQSSVYFKQDKNVCVCASACVSVCVCGVGGQFHKATQEWAWGGKTPGWCCYYCWIRFEDDREPFKHRVSVWALNILTLRERNTHTHTWFFTRNRHKTSYKIILILFYIHYIKIYSLDILLNNCKVKNVIFLKWWLYATFLTKVAHFLNKMQASHLPNFL